MRQVYPEFPSKTTTGVTAGVSLTTYTGDRYINPTDHGDNYVFSNMLFPEGLVVEVNNLTLVNCKIQADNPYGLRQLNGYTGLTVSRTEVTSLDPGSSEWIDRAVSIEGGGALLDRVKIHKCWRGINGFADNIVVIASFIGDNNNPTGEHASGFHCDGGADHVRLLYNTWECVPGTETSGILAIYPESGANTDFFIRGNLFKDSGVYTVRVGYTPPESPNSDFQVFDNWFSTEYLSYTSADANYPTPPGAWAQVAGTSWWNNNRWFDLRATGGGYTNKHGDLVASERPW